MKQVNPKTQAVIDAFLDMDTPEHIRKIRAVELREKRPKLFSALEELIKATQ